jgi:hypothetical protein
VRKAGWRTPDPTLLSNDMPPRVLRLPVSPAERFLANFMRRLAWRGDCLEWTGHVAKTGYGIYRTRGAHVVAYELWFGAVPSSLFVLHTCDNPVCCSPDHLVAGSQADNMAHKAARGRARGGSRPGCFGELNNAAKVSTEQAQMALDLAESGWWQAEISRRTGIPVGNVGAIIRRKTWVHLVVRVGMYVPPTALPRRWQRFEPGTKLP